MKNEKKLMIVILAFVFIMVFGLCIEVPGTLAADKKITIKLWHVYGPEMKPANEWFTGIIAAFEKENPNIHVEQETTPNDPYKLKLKTALQTGEAPDAMMVYTGGFMETFAKRGYFLPVDKYLDQDGWRNDFMPAVFGSMTFNGKTYGFPLAIRTVHIFYNKDVFKKYNLKPVKTMGELKEMMETLKKNGVTPFALGNKERWMGNFWTNYLFVRYGGYEAWANAVAGKGKGWADPSHVKAFALLQELVKMKAFTEGTNGVGAMDVNNSFFTGEAGMALHGSFFVNIVSALSPKGFLDEKLGYFNFPLIEGGKGSMLDYHGGIAGAFSINATTKHPEETVAFFRFITRKENVTSLAKKAGWVTTIKDSVPSDAHFLTKSLAAEVNKMEHLITYSDFTLIPEVYQHYADAAQAVFGLQITPEEAAKRIEKAARQ